MLRIPRRRARVLIALLGLAIILTRSASAQETRTLRGTVTDATGGVIVAARASLQGEDGWREETTTDERGVYEFVAPAPGRYVLGVEHDAFAPFERLVDLRTPRAAPLDVALTVQLAEEVSVSSTLSLPDSPLSRTLSRQELALLPSSGRHLLRRLRELAGTRGRRGDVIVYVDGFRGSRGLRIPPKDRIQMVRISAHPFDAEFAEPGHSRIEITTRPGVDRFTLDGTFTFNDDRLNDRDFFAPVEPSLLMRHGTLYLGGPVLRDRLSASAFGGRWEEDTSEVFRATVLDPATLEPVPAEGTVPTPTRIDNLLVGLDTIAGRRHTMMLLAGGTREQAGNQGLDTAFDLPDRAYAATARDVSVRGSLLSILSPKLLNDLHVEAGRRRRLHVAVSGEPTVLVLDAFHDGASSVGRFDERGDSIQIRDTLTRAFGAHTVKAGVQVEGANRRSFDSGDFAGRFVFGGDVERDESGAPVRDPSGRTIPLSSLERYRRTRLGLPGYGPSQFSIVDGDPLVEFDQWWASWFLQDDWRPWQRLTLSAGVRQDWQSYVDRWQDVAGRAGLGWTVDARGRHVVRAGTGLFLGRFGSDLLLDVTRLDGLRQRQIVLQQPAFFPVIPGDLDAGTRPPVVYRNAPDLATPYVWLSTAGYEWKAGPLAGALEYVNERGERLLLRRNVNRPLADGTVPEPALGPIYQYDSLGASRRQEVLASLRASLRSTMTIEGGYTRTWSRTITDGPRTAPSNPDDLSSEWGLGINDRDHRIHLGATVYLPRQTYLSAYLSAASGRPFNITTGRDDNGDTLFTDRPSFASPDEPGAIVTPFGAFDPDPEPGETPIPRNFGRGPWEGRLDLHLSKVFSLPGGVRFTAAADVGNLTNRASYTRFTGVVASPLFGEPNRALAARRVLLTGRISY